MSVERLLTEITTISEKYKLLNKETGGGFNVFEAADISTDEVTICRVLYEILSPKGSHAQGADFLKPFIKNVLKIEMPDDELKTTTVYRELGIKDNRRIDLVIRTNNRLIPIEVKIYAKDQTQQCFDYFQKAKASPVYYLTRFGEPPTAKSANELMNTDNIKCLSFAGDILKWLEHCVSLQNTPPIREVLLQFIDAIRNFTNQPEGKMEKDIIEVMSASEDSIRSAVLIEKSLNACKTAMLKRLLETVEKQVGAEKLLNKWDFAENPSLITDYYSQKSSTYPGISYMYKRDVKPGIDVWVRLEIDYRVYVGYCVMTGDTPAPTALSANEIELITGGLSRAISESRFIHWEYLPRNTKPATPNFKDFSDARNTFYDFFDTDKFNIFVNDCAARISELLDNSGAKIKP